MICQKCSQKCEKNKQLNSMKNILKQYMESMFSTMAETFARKMKNYFEELQNLQDKLQNKIACRMSAYRKAQKSMEKMGQYIEALQISFKIQEKAYRKNSSNVYQEIQQKNIQRSHLLQQLDYSKEKTCQFKDEYKELLNLCNDPMKFSFHKRKSVNQGWPSKEDATLLGLNQMQNLAREQSKNDQKSQQHKKSFLDKQNRNHINLGGLNRRGVTFYSINKDIKARQHQSQQRVKYKVLHKSHSQNHDYNTKKNYKFFIRNDKLDYLLHNGDQNKWEPKQGQNKIKFTTFGNTGNQQSEPKILANFRFFRK